MNSALTVAFIIMATACGDNITPSSDTFAPDAGASAEDDSPPAQGGDEDTQSGNEDTQNGSPSDAGTAPPDGRITGLDMAAARAACCVGLLESGSVPIECYPPKGTCRFDLVCRGEQFTLCSP